MASNPQDDRKLWLSAGGLLLILLFAYNFLNPPQCPDNYSQAQVDESNCIIGANIGLGFVLILIWPILVVVAALLILAIYRRFRKSSGSTKAK